MVEHQRKRCRFPYLDKAIFQPSKTKLVLGFSQVRYSLYHIGLHIGLVSRFQFKTLVLHCATFSYEWRNMFLAVQICHFFEFSIFGLDRHHHDSLIQILQLFGSIIDFGFSVILKNSGFKLIREF